MEIVYKDEDVQICRHHFLNLVNIIVLYLLHDVVPDVTLVWRDISPVRFLKAGVWYNELY